MPSRLVLIFSISILLPASKLTTCAAQTTKDATALSALAQMAAATGWNPANPPADAVLGGSVTRNSQTTAVPITLKMRGLSQSRCDVQSGGGVTSTIVNNGQAGQVLPDGSTHLLSGQDAASIWPVYLPLFSDLVSATSSPNISVSYMGTEIANNSTSNKIQVAVRVPPSDPRFVNSASAQFIVWLDVNTGLPVQLQYTELASDNSSASISVLHQFSNYRQVNGIQVAFSQREYVGTSLLYTIEIGTVAFNVGLTDADFVISTAPQGGL